MELRDSSSLRKKLSGTSVRSKKGSRPKYFIYISDILPSYKKLSSKLNSSLRHFHRKALMFMIIAFFLIIPENELISLELKTKCYVYVIY
jgi:hypothetical protein